MGGEIGNFKGRLFGGFDRHDVTEYIEKLASERNKYKAELDMEKDRAETLAVKLSEAEESLALERDKADSERFRIVEETERMIKETHGQFEKIKAQMEETLEHVRCELTLTAGSFDQIITALNTASEHFARLEDEAQKLKVSEASEEIEIL